MNKTGILLVLTIGLISSGTNVLATSLSDKLKEAESNFNFLYKGKHVTVLDQKVTQRAVREKQTTLYRSTGDCDTNCNHTQCKVWQDKTLAYSAFFIEFTYTGLKVDLRSAKKADLLDKNGKILFTQLVSLKHRHMQSESENKQGVSYLAISLEGVPLTILDDVHTVHFKK